ncbi:hypothetical protein Cus16_2586 [Curtobacterium sp. ER1/6]|nr:hypothetical protein Cus16_2586 [Curtobacterium sp. ER1/6]
MHTVHLTRGDPGDLRHDRVIDRGLARSARGVAARGADGARGTGGGRGGRGGGGGVSHWLLPSRPAGTRSQRLLFTDETG